MLFADDAALMTFSHTFEMTMYLLASYQNTTRSYTRRFQMPLWRQHTTNFAYPTLTKHNISQYLFYHLLYATFLKPLLAKLPHIPHSHLLLRGSSYRAYAITNITPINRFYSLCTREFQRQRAPDVRFDLCTLFDLY